MPKPIFATVDPAATAWINKNVLTRTYLKSCGGVKLVRSCPCENDRCGRCGDGQHDKCVIRVGFNGKPPVRPVTHIVGRKGAALTPVRLSGTSCRLVCSCEVCEANPPAQVEKTTAYRRVTGGKPCPGDTVWLIPKTLGCPAICWKQPRALVIGSAPMYLVVSVDGQEHRIHVDNIRYTDPAAAKVPAPATPKPRKPMPDDFIEVTLF